MLKKTATKYIPLVIALLLALISVKETYLSSRRVIKKHTIESTFWDLEEIQRDKLTDEQLTVSIALLVITFLAILKMELWSYAFFVMCLSSTLGLGRVFMYTYTAGFLSVKLELISLTLVVGHVFFDKNLGERIKRFLGLDKGEARTESSVLVKHYYNTYSEHPSGELVELIESNGFATEAKTAFRQILDERRYLMSPPNNHPLYDQLCEIVSEMLPSLGFKLLSKGDHLTIFISVDKMTVTIQHGGYDMPNVNFGTIGDFNCLRSWGALEYYLDSDVPIYKKHKELKSLYDFKYDFDLLKEHHDSIRLIIESPEDYKMWVNDFDFSLVLGTPK